MSAEPILAIPPFPGAKLPRFAERAEGGSANPEILLEALARHRVGGCYWGRQRALPTAPFALDATAARAGSDAVVWGAGDDPWHLLARATSATVKTNDPRGLLAVAVGLPVTVVDEGGTIRAAGDQDIARWMATGLTGWRYADPFTGSPLDLLEAIDLCGFWRQLIDANRPIRSVMGIASWKKPTVSALLWGGDEVPYDRAIGSGADQPAVALWRTRMSKGQARMVANSDVRVFEIEDGFIRSQGLGADCVPPLSIIVDIAIQRTLDALAERSDDVVLVSHDGDFLPQMTRLLDDEDRRLGLMGFREYRNAGFVELEEQGMETFDLEYEVHAFNARLPRMRIIPIHEFDPLEFL